MLLDTTVNPLCAGCLNRIGEMTLDTYARAIAYRGKYLLCPECRVHHCDCCGNMMIEECRKVYIVGDYQYLGNACSSCWSWVISDNPTKIDFPNFSLNAKPNFQGFPASQGGGKLIIESEVW